MLPAPFRLVYFPRPWCLLKFFFKILACLSCYKEKNGEGVAQWWPNHDKALHQMRMGSNLGLPFARCVTLSELLSLSET